MLDLEFIGEFFPDPSTSTTHIKKENFPIKTEKSVDSSCVNKTCQCCSPINMNQSDLG